MIVRRALFEDTEQLYERLLCRGLSIYSAQCLIRRGDRFSIMYRLVVRFSQLQSQVRVDRSEASLTIVPNQLVYSSVRILKVRSVLGDESRTLDSDRLCPSDSSTARLCRRAVPPTYS
jgi:hypothetical protein